MSDEQTGQDDIRNAPRMDAYYFSFDETNVPEIDLVLSAVAWAGKLAHHTEMWDEPIASGPSSVAWIQASATAAADEIVRLRTRVAELEAAVRAGWDLREVNEALYAQDLSFWQDLADQLSGPARLIAEADIDRWEWTEPDDVVWDRVQPTQQQVRDAIDGVAAYDRARTPATQEPT